jgi:methylmalonyl-CoA/ethylmalonyl-CoA epimerase
MCVETGEMANSSGEIGASKQMEGRMDSRSGTTQSAVSLNKIGQIAVTVRDLARAKDFYWNVLGMRFLFDAGNMCFFQCGEIRFTIGLAEEQIPLGGTILYFKVEDIHKTHESLKAQNVEFVQAPHLVARMPDHDLWLAFLKDPDGNTLGLMSEIQRA